VQGRHVGNDDGIDLAIDDSGIGFDPAQNRAEAGSGLGSMKERVELIHGRFFAKSEPRVRIAINVTARLSGG